jgi:hypothetical protein
VESRLTGLTLAVLVSATALGGCGSDRTAPEAGLAGGSDRDVTSLTAPLSAPDSSPAATGAPVVLTEADGDLGERWREFTAGATFAEPDVASGPMAIPGLTPYDGAAIVLDDGRLVLRGTWDGDEPLVGSHRMNPAMAPDGEDNPVVETSARPVRVFLHDPATGDLRPLSPVPQVRAFATATRIGASADAVLELALLADRSSVAFLLGFQGAAYDIPHELHVVPIPPP